MATKNGKKQQHWAQTDEGRERLRALTRESWARRKRLAARRAREESTVPIILSTDTAENDKGETGGATLLQQLDEALAHLHNARDVVASLGRVIAQQ